MAVQSTAVWEVQSGGAALNAGGYDPGIAGAGTDYSQQTAAQATGTATSAGTTLTATTGIFTNLMVGNAITDGITYVFITGFTSSTIVTVDRDPSWTAVSISVGGALDRPDRVMGTSPVVVSGNTVFVLGGGTFTSATTETIGADGGITGTTRLIGYKTGNRSASADISEADMPTFTSATTGINIFSLNGANSVSFANIKCTQTFGTPTSRGSGWVNVTTASNDIRWRNCVCDGCLVGWHLGTSAVTSPTQGTLIGCTARNCTSTTLAGFYSANTSATYLVFINCVSHHNASHGWALGTATVTNFDFRFECCIAHNNTGDGLVFAGTTGVAATAPVVIDGLYAYANANGIHFKITTGSYRYLIKNCILESNTIGMLCDTASVSGLMQQFNNAYFGNGTAKSNIPAASTDITLTASPATAPTNGDFRLNGAAGGGAVLRGGGFPTVVGVVDDLTSSYVTTRTYIDVGPSTVKLPTVATVGSASIS